MRRGCALLRISHCCEPHQINLCWKFKFRRPDRITVNTHFWWQSDLNFCGLSGRLSPAASLLQSVGQVRQTTLDPEHLFSGGQFRSGNAILQTPGDTYRK